MDRNVRERKTGDMMCRWEWERQGIWRSEGRFDVKIRDTEKETWCNASLLDITRTQYTLMKVKCSLSLFLIAPLIQGIFRIQLRFGKRSFRDTIMIWNTDMKFFPMKYYWIFFHLICSSVAEQLHIALVYIIGVICIGGIERSFVIIRAKIGK